MLNREVQINVKSITDIWIDAITEKNEKITLCIEVKGSWNTSVKTALESQLVEKYINNDGANAGIYLVGYFEKEKFNDLSQLLNKQIENIKMEIKKPISVLVLDCFY